MIDRAMDWSSFEIVLNKISEVQDFVNFAINASHDITVTNDKGYKVDGKSLMGMFSIDPSNGVSIKVYDEDLNDDFATFIKNHQIFRHG